MKAFATLVCLLIGTAGFAQQNLIKEKRDSVRNIDNMPILKGDGNAIDMPTRNGKGDALPMPNRSMPVPSVAGEQISVKLKALGEPLKLWPADSLNWLNPTMTLPSKKN